MTDIKGKFGDDTWAAIRAAEQPPTSGIPGPAVAPAPLPTPQPKPQRGTA